MTPKRAEVFRRLFPFLLLRETHVAIVMNVRGKIMARSSDPAEIVSAIVEDAARREPKGDAAEISVRINTSTGQSVGYVVLSVDPERPYMEFITPLRYGLDVVARIKAVGAEKGVTNVSDH